ncbi:MAG: hypothetical protein JNK56_07040 [Myxococcales bacterium]|nr:hypothetical protein [Myxococcales bacterium]
MSTILDDGKAARDIAARTPEADNDYEIEVHAAACWLEAAGRGDALLRADHGPEVVRRKVDWLRAREAAAASRPAPLAPDPELRQAIHDRLFGKEES